MWKKVFTGRVKLDKSNFNEEKMVYEAQASYKDWEVVKFTYSPEAWISNSGVEYIGRVQVEGNERPTNIKEKQNEKGVFIYGCVNFDEDKRCNMRKGQSEDSIPTFTISFSKPDPNEEHPFNKVEVEEGSKKDTEKKETKVEDKKEDEDLPF